MIKRNILKTLEIWAKSSDHKPLLIRGARQVGKTHAVETLATSFKSFVSINFELQPKYQACFDELDPNVITASIALLEGQEIKEGETLLFLDEVQVCPKAITALRYFREMMPGLHVIAAGSLLEFVLQHESISMPVGRIEYLYIYPCTFTEFLENVAPSSSVKLLEKATLDNPLPAVIHEAMLGYFKTYMVIGGMPEAISHYIKNKDLYAVQRVQNAILQTYRDDFGKYATLAKHKYLQRVYSQVPGMIGEQVSYHKIDPESRSRDLKEAIQLLEYAGLLKRVLYTAASGLNLITTTNEKKFKLTFLDVGLVQRATGISVELLLAQDFKKLNDGALAEQVVGQLLLSEQDPYTTPELFFWARDAKNSQAELDFIVNNGGQIIPIEVKSGPNGKLKSLMAFLKERNLPLGIKISSAALSYDSPVLNIPFYLVGELDRLLEQFKIKLK